MVRPASPPARAAWVCATALLLAVPAVAQPVLTPALPSCVPADGNAATFLNVTSENGLTSVRTYFRKAGEKDFYYMEMRASKAGRHWTVLPVPEDETTAVEIQMAAVDGHGIETRSTVESVPVTGKCRVALTEEQASLASSLVVGETAGAQKEKKVLGFRCVGIVARVDYQDEFRADEQCRRFLLGGRWVVPLALIGVAAGGYAVVEGQEECPPSPCVPCDKTRP